MDEQTFWANQAPIEPEVLPPTELHLEVPQEVSSLVQSPANFVTLASEFKVDSEPTFQVADEMQSRWKEEAKQINEKRLEFTRPLDALKTKWMNVFKPAIDARSQAAVIIQNKMSGFRRQQREIAEKAQREAERLLREEQERKEAEARRLEAKAAKLKTVAAQEKAMQQADEIRATAALMPQSVALAAAVPQTVASSVAEIWEVEQIVNLSDYLRWLADHPEWHCVLNFKASEHNRLAKQFHSLGVPGLKFGQRDSFRSKPRR